MLYPPRPAVAIIGAGRYGVSTAAHMGSAGIDFRIFGKPLDRWRRAATDLPSENGGDR